MEQSQVVQASQASAGCWQLLGPRRCFCQPSEPSRHASALIAAPDLCSGRLLADGATFAPGCRLATVNATTSAWATVWRPAPLLVLRTETDPATAVQPPGPATGRCPAGASFPLVCVRIGNAQGFRGVTSGGNAASATGRNGRLSCISVVDPDQWEQPTRPESRSRQERRNTHRYGSPQLWTRSDRAGESGSPHHDATAAVVPATTGAPHRILSWHPAS